MKFRKLKRGDTVHPHHLPPINPMKISQLAGCQDIRMEGIEENRGADLSLPPLIP